jgi:hypothetical protein
VLHGVRKPPSVFLVTTLVLGRQICIVGGCPRGCGGTTLFHHPTKRMTWRAEPVAELRPCRGQLFPEEILHVRGLPVLVWRYPIPLSLDTQGLTLGSRGYLGLGQGLVGFGRVVKFHGWLIYVPGEDVRGNRHPPRSYFSQLICGLVVPSSNMVELQPMELIFQVPNFIAIGLHHLVAAVGVLHDLVNDKL